MQAGNRSRCMTFVTMGRARPWLIVALACLSALGCAETGAIGNGAPTTTAATIAVPTPAPLPPPPKPTLRQARPAPKVAAKTTPSVAEHATNGAAEQSEPAPSDTSQTADAPAVETPEQRLALRSPGVLPPIRLIGLDRNATTALLGAPAAQRQVAVARVWDYRAPDCRLAVYFYLDTGRNDFYALHYEIDGPEAGPDGEQHCLQRIRDARGN